MAEPHKFPAPDGALSRALPDRRQKFLHGGDDDDRIHVGLGGEHVANTNSRRYWQGNLISGVFSPQTQVRGADHARARLHFLGFVDEGKYTQGTFARSTVFIANPHLFASATAARTALGDLAPAASAIADTGLGRLGLELARRLLGAASSKATASTRSHPGRRRQLNHQVLAGSRRRDVLPAVDAYERLVLEHGVNEPCSEDRHQYRVSLRASGMHGPQNRSVKARNGSPLLPAIPKIKQDERLAVLPFAQQLLPVCGGNGHRHGIALHDLPETQRRNELLPVVPPREAIHHPAHQRAIDRLAGGTLFLRNLRVLKLKHHSVRGLHVCKMPLPILGTVKNFLPVLRKHVLPSAVPFGLWLPVVIEVSPWVGPVRHSDPATSWLHRHFADRARARKTALCLSLFVINNRVLHFSNFHRCRKRAIAGCLRAVVAFYDSDGGAACAPHNVPSGWMR